MNENLSNSNKEELDALLGTSEGGEAQQEKKNGDIEARIEELKREKQKLEEEKKKKIEELETLESEGAKEEEKTAEEEEQGIEFGYEVGDKAQWVINGVLQWEGGKVIEKIEEDPKSGKKFALFEGVSTSVPFEQLTLYVEPAEKVEDLELQELKDRCEEVLQESEKEREREREEEATAKSELQELRSELEKKRGEYVSAYGEYRKNLKNKDEEIKNQCEHEATTTKEQYDNVKQKLAEKMRDNGIESFKIFNELILKENELLNNAKVESWPPKEKGILRKGIEWYMRQPIALRLLISTGIVTGAVAAYGGFSASAAAMFAGYRFVRGAGAVLLGKLAGQGFDWIASKYIKSEYETSLNRLKNNFNLDNLKETESALEELIEAKAEEERYKTLIKGLVSIAAGVGTSAGMNILEHHYLGADEVAGGAMEQKMGETSSHSGDGVGTETAGGEAQHLGTETAGETEQSAPTGEGEQHSTPTLEDEGKNKIFEAATIHKGEGVEHTLIRQLESDPEKFECPKEIIDKGPDAIHKWAGGEAHRIAIKEEYVKVLPDGSVQETRVYYDPKEETQYILRDDKSVQEVKTEGMEYTYTRPTEEDVEPGTPPGGQEEEYVPEPGTPPGQEYVPEPGTPPGGQEEYVPEPGTRPDQGEEYVPESGTEPGATTGSETAGGVVPEAAHGTGTTGMEQGAGTGTGQHVEHIPTPAQIDANLTQQAENIGQNIEKQTTGFWRSLFGGKGRWDYYKEQNVNDFNEWWRAKNEADSLAWKNLQNPKIYEFEERGDERFKIRLVEYLFGNRHLAEEDKHLTVFEYMKKLLKK